MLLNFFLGLSEIPAISLDNKIAPGDMESWFVQEYSGYMDQDTKYLTSFTLKYDSTEDALFDINPTSGEWSIRLYSLNDGESQSYNEDVKSDIYNAWRELIQRFTSKEC